VRKFVCLMSLSTLWAFVGLSDAAATPPTVQRLQQSQGSGLTWAEQAMAALTGGNTVSSVNESGTITWTIGNNQGTGTLTLQSSSDMSSEIQLTTSAGNRTETRSWPSDGNGPVGQWTDLNGQPHNMAQQNCWTDAVWFFPALSLLSDYSDPSMVYVDLGQTQYNGQTVEHVQAYRQFLQSLTTVDYYLDSQTSLPVAMAFYVHGDNDINANIPVTIAFSDYQAIDGVQAPFQISRSINGQPLYQITISSVTVNGQGSPQRRQ
jgi:hypothetical protein